MFLGKIIVETQSEDYCAKRLLVPQLDDLEPLHFSAQFKQNQNYQFDALDQQVDRSKVSEEEFRALKAQKRQEHERLDDLRLKIQFGRQAGSIKTENGIWAVGMNILLQIFQFTNDEYVGPFAKSFYKAFLDDSGQRSTEQCANDLVELINHPGGFQVLEQFVGNFYIPLRFKLSICQLLKGQYYQITSFKLGRMFVACLANQLRKCLQLKSEYYGLEAVPIQINLDALRMMCFELKSSKKFALLNKTPDGVELVKALSLEQFMVDKQRWAKEVTKYLEKQSRKAGAAGADAEK